MKKLLAALLVAMSPIVALADSAQAGVIASNALDTSVPNDSGGYSQNGQKLATQFNLTSASTLTGAEWNGALGSGAINGSTWSFAIRIYADSSGSVGSLLDEVSTNAIVNNSGLVVGGDVSYHFTASLGSLDLSSGSYWLSIVNTGSQNQFRWTKGLGSLASAVGLGSNWYNFAENWRTPMNFTLSGNEVSAEVPEPAMLGLFGMGAVALGLTRRRRA